MFSDEESIWTAVKAHCKGHLWAVTGTAESYKHELHLKLSELEKYRQLILNFHIITKLKHAHSSSKELQLLQRETGKNAGKKNLKKEILK